MQEGTAHQELDAEIKHYLRVYLNAISAFMQVSRVPGSNGLVSKLSNSQTIELLLGPHSVDRLD